MRPAHWFCCAALLCGWLASAASAQQAVRWQVDLEAAKRYALQTNRMVLVHFWASWCVPCKEMEREVLSRPEVMAALAADYVPVKVNADHFPHTCRQYDVSVLPSDIIITPQGQLIEKMDGASDLSQYLARLNQVAAVARNRSGGRPGEPMRSGPPPLAAQEQVAARPAEIPTHQRQEYGHKSPPESSDDRYADYFNRRGRGTSPPAGPSFAGPVTAPHGPPVAANHASMRPGIPEAQGSTAPQVQALQREAVSAPTPTIQLPAGNPPIGLDGYCSVRLAEEGRWVLGDVRWGLIHRGRTYLFAGPEERDRFDVAPDRYAPALSGNDAVLAVERGEMVPGRREHGAWFEKQVYLFSSETTFEKFNADPYRYVSALETREQPAPPNTARYPAGRPQRRAMAPGTVPGMSRY